MEMRIQKLDRPTLSPRIRGPRMLPSNCCSRRMKMTKMKHWKGLIRRIRIAEGMAPISGPKNGMTFVTPMITEISIG